MFTALGSDFQVFTATGSDAHCLTGPKWRIRDFSGIGLGRGDKLVGLGAKIASLMM
jgi:hypothetical protein